MKKIIFSSLILALIGVGFIGCEKEVKIPGESNSTESSSKELNFPKSQNKSMDSDDPLVIALTELNDYLVSSNDVSDEEFFNYTVKNPDYTWEEIAELGFVDLDYLDNQVNIIEDAVEGRDESEILEIVTKTVNSGLRNVDVLDSDFQGPAFRICLFCCSGCMDGDRTNNVFEVLFWTWGSGTKP